jgi:hypothetical protein
MARPPRKDRWAIYVIEAEDETSAMLTALQWAAWRCDVVKPIESEIIEILEI